MAKANLTAARLRELLHYDADAGVFTRLVQRGGLGRPGSRPNTLSNYGYPLIGVDGVLYLAHRLAWLYVRGEWPVGYLDHINGVKTDYRICNLRDATQHVNMQNLRKPTRLNRSGYLGVCRNHNRFRATIKIDGKQKFLGNFDSAEEAHAAYLEAKRKHHEGCTI